MDLFPTIEVRIRLDVGHGFRTPSEKPKSAFFSIIFIVEKVMIENIFFLNNFW